MIIAKEFTEQNKKQLLDMINEINEYDADFEGLEHVGKMEDYSAFLRNWKNGSIKNKSPQIILLKQLLAYLIMKN